MPQNVHHNKSRSIAPTYHGVAQMSISESTGMQTKHLNDTPVKYNLSHNNGKDPGHSRVNYQIDNSTEAHNSSR